jgi:glucosyl-3-phosphoglycerate synthase
MADFHQTGVITTFHRFGETDITRMEKELAEFNRHQPIALVLPITPTELSAPAIERILADLRCVEYINEMVITVGRTSDPEDFRRAKVLFSALPQKKHLIWASGPSMGRLYRLLDENGLTAGPDGKGRSAWIAYGFILAREESKVIALHDCDIVNYSRELLGRLCYPIASPNIDYAFCKGYYARVTDRMHGRVTRLFVTPLVRSLMRLFGPLQILVYLDSFRYPLAGEFSMITELARINRIPSDWGLEVETLAEVYRNYSLRRICQIELCETYEHKHQPLSPEDPKIGLMKMSIDIAKSVFRSLAMEGAVISESALKTLLVNYQRTAQDVIKRYSDDSAINGLTFDLHQESVIVDAFTRAIHIAGQEYLDNPGYSPLIPNWNRVTSALPNFMARLVEAVDVDNQIA